MKERLDVLLVRQGLAPSREKAKLVIMAGDVFVNGQREDKAGAAFDEEKSRIEVRGAALPYVGRGGLKLEKALQVFPIRVDGLVCMDVGASTGGFTDCMLQNGAAKVYAVDVGHGQLAWKLRNDKRVVCMEKTNFRYMKPEDINEALDFAACDASFISLTKLLQPAWQLLKPQAAMVCLIKPQFEAGREQVGKKGVVRDAAVHREVIERILSFAEGIGFAVRGLDYSPIKGPEGNIEYLAFLQKRGDGAQNDGADRKVGTRADGKACGTKADRKACGTRADGKACGTKAAESGKTESGKDGSATQELTIQEAVGQAGWKEAAKDVVQKAHDALDADGRK